MPQCLSAYIVYSVYSVCSARNPLLQHNRLSGPYACSVVLALDVHEYNSDYGHVERISHGSTTSL